MPDWALEGSLGRVRIFGSDGGTLRCYVDALVENSCVGRVLKVFVLEGSIVLWSVS